MRKRNCGKPWETTGLCPGLCVDAFAHLLDGVQVIEKKRKIHSFRQLTTQRGCSSVRTRIPGRVAASDSRLVWATSCGSH